MKKKLLSLFTATFLLCTSTLDSISVMAETSLAEPEVSKVKDSDGEIKQSEVAEAAAASTATNEAGDDGAKISLDNNPSLLAETAIDPADIVFTNNVPTKAINSNTGIDFNWAISTVKGEKEVHTGDKIVLNISSAGLDYTTVKFSNGSTTMENFQLSTDSDNNQIILTYIGSGMTFTSSTPTVITLSGSPTKTAENTDKTVTYPFTSQFISQAGQTVDYTAANMVLSVLNNNTGYNILGGGSFGTNVWGELPATSDKYQANDAKANSAGIFEYYYTQGAQIWTSGFFNSIGHDYEESDGPYTFTVTTNYPIETSSIKLSRGKISGFIDGSDRYSVNWLPGNYGFTVTFPKLINGAAFATNYYVITGDDSNGAKVEISTTLTNGEGAVIMDGQKGTGVYKYVPNGAFIPVINTSDAKVYTTDPALDLKSLATASDQTDGDITKFIEIQDDGGFNQAVAGEYTITYYVENKAGNTAIETATVTVLQDQQAINGEDFSMYVGDSEPTADSFKASATDKTGAVSAVSIDLSKADLSTAGEYEVVITSADGQTKTVKLTVKANEQSINGEDFSMYVGDLEPTADSFKASATDKTGAVSAVSIDLSKADLSTAGEYEVVITSADGQTKTVKLTVKANEQSINGEDFLMYVGDSEPTADSFKASATDKTGAVSAVSIDLSKADLSTAGEYEVVITSADGQTKTVKLTVKANEQSINGEDFSMYVGDSEPTADSFKASATDKTGAVSAVSIDLSKADLSTAGEYEVVITSADGQTKTVKLTVKANEQSINGEDFLMYVGDSEPTADSFKASATDKTGAVSAVSIDLSKADLSTAGEYEVVITSADGQTKTVKLTVKEKPLDPKSKDSTSASTSKKDSESLPQTSEVKTSASVIAGILTVLASFVLFRRKNKQ